MTAARDTAAGTAKPVSIAVDDANSVSGLLQVPTKALACYVMAHGAGAGMTHSFMASFANDLAERDIAGVRPGPRAPANVVAHLLLWNAAHSTRVVSS